MFPLGAAHTCCLLFVVHIVVERVHKLSAVVLWVHGNFFRSRHGLKRSCFNFQVEVEYEPKQVEIMLFTFISDDTHAFVSSVVILERSLTERPVF